MCRLILQAFDADQVPVHVSGHKDAPTDATSGLSLSLPPPPLSLVVVVVVVVVTA